MLLDNDPRRVALDLASLYAGMEADSEFMDSAGEGNPLGALVAALLVK